MGWAQLIRPFPFDEARKGRRFKVSLPVILTQASLSARANLVELSSHGAQARSLTPFDKEAVVLEWEGKHVPAHIVWKRGDRLGLVFDRPLTPLQLSAMLAD